MILTPSSRLCTKCFFFETQAFDPETGESRAVANCIRCIDPVWGTKLSAYLAREFGGDCGPDGVLFELHPEIEARGE